MARQLCCRGMCKNLLRSDGQQRNYDKAKFPSNLNCGQKTVSGTGPCRSRLSANCLDDNTFGPWPLSRYVWVILTLLTHIYCQWTASSLVNVMAVDCSEPSHYLSQQWLTVIWTLGNKFTENLVKYQCFFFKENAFDVCEMVAISFRPQCINSLRPSDTYICVGNLGHYWFR